MLDLSFLLSLDLKTFQITSLSLFYLCSNFGFFSLYGFVVEQIGWRHVPCQFFAPVHVGAVSLFCYV